MVQELEKVAQLTKEEAKKILIDNILEDARHDAPCRCATLSRKQRTRPDAEAKKIISLAIQRCASDQASELTVSVVPLPTTT